MTKQIIGAVILGILAGYFILPDEYAKSFLQVSETLLIVGLSLLLFFVGMDLGMDGSVVANCKRIGWRVLMLPIAIIIGSFAGAAIASVFISTSLKESVAISAGFGWYTLAPVILAKYSAEVSAISFMHNVMREIIGLVLIPIVAKRLGYLETCSLPGCSSMDVGLPIIERTTSPTIAIYGFVSGAILSIAVPFFVPLIIGL